MSYTFWSLRSMFWSKSPRWRVRTPEISGRRPTCAEMASARSASSSAKAEPTVPWPSSPTLKVSATTSRVPLGQIVVGFAPNDDAGVAAGAEDHRRAREGVVVVGHGVAGGAGRGSDQHVAGSGPIETGLAHEDVTGLAMHSGDGARIGAAEPVGDLRLVARVVEHRAKVVHHPAVDRHVCAHPRNLLHGPDCVDRDPSVPHERAAGLAEHGHSV